jgi:hypothetical protein
MILIFYKHPDIRVANMTQLLIVNLFTFQTLHHQIEKLKLKSFNLL